MKKIQISIWSVALLSVAFVGLPVFAISTTLGGTVGVNVSTTDSSTKLSVKAQAALTTRIQTGQTRAGQEIDRRVTVLNDLNVKVSAMTRLSTSEKTSISTFITQQVSSLTTLKTKNLADTDIATLKVDVKSITDSYRIFMLVVPQVNVIRTTDAMVETSQMLGTLGAKLQTRITAAGTAGSNVSALNTLMSDFSAKINDAQTQAQASVTVVSSLQPDQGDAATIAANKAAFAGARVDIKTARADLATARNDAGKIVTALKAMKPTTSVGTSANVTASTTTQ